MYSFTTAFTEVDSKDGLVRAVEGGSGEYFPIERGCCPDFEVETGIVWFVVAAA